MKLLRRLLLAVLVSVVFATPAPAVPVKPGDVITPDNASLVQYLVSPGNMVLIRQGMRIKIAPTERLEWPPPYKSATEKYASQVHLNDKGELENYIAGLPFPLLNPNDPQAAAKVMWNFSFRPQYSDDADIRQVEVVSSRSTGSVVEHFTIGHFAFYNSMGRTEVQPIPTDPEATGAGIRYRFGAFPFLEPAELHGFGLVRERSVDPAVDDNAWYYNPLTRKVRRATATSLSDAMGPVSAGISLGGGGRGSTTYANNLDPDSYFGFMAKIEDYNYKLLGIEPMLACVEAENIPAKPGEFDNGRSVCPESWEMRQLYVIEATIKPRSWSQKIGGEVIIPKRVLYIDSEGWFITASDQYDLQGKLWKTIATFNAYRDRPIPDAKVAIYPFKRIFQTALVDEDIQDGFSSVVYMPGRETEEHECWYVNMGIVTKSFLDPHQMEMRAD
ncbi:MAG: DUF1329 domain-containing protein [Candidatus Binataceae bacterium]